MKLISFIPKGKVEIATITSVSIVTIKKCKISLEVNGQYEAQREGRVILGKMPVSEPLVGILPDQWQTK